MIVHSDSSPTPVLSPSGLCDVHPDTVVMKAPGTSLPLYCEPLKAKAMLRAPMAPSAQLVQEEGVQTRVLCLLAPPGLCPAETVSTSPSFPTRLAHNLHSRCPDVLPADR